MDIISIKSKALKLLIERNDTRLIPGKYVRKVRAVLDVLNDAQNIADVLAYPYGRPHKLKGDRAGTYAISVYANWRITFEYNEIKHTIHILDFEDYH